MEKGRVAERAEKRRLWEVRLIHSLVDRAMRSSERFSCPICDNYANTGGTMV